MRGMDISKGKIAMVFQYIATQYLFTSLALTTHMSNTGHPIIFLSNAFTPLSTTSVGNIERRKNFVVFGPSNVDIVVPVVDVH